MHMYSKYPCPLPRPCPDPNLWSFTCGIQKAAVDRTVRGPPIPRPRRRPRVPRKFWARQAYSCKVVWNNRLRMPTVKIVAAYLVWLMFKGRDTSSPARKACTVFSLLHQTKSCLRNQLHPDSPQPDWLSAPPKSFLVLNLWSFTCVYPCTRPSPWAVHTSQTPRKDDCFISFSIIAYAHVFKVSLSLAPPLPWPEPLVLHLCLSMHQVIPEAQGQLVHYWDQANTKQAVCMSSRPSYSAEEYFKLHLAPAHV